jgi:hypothetical protein
MPRARAPSHLSDAGHRLWREWTAAYEFEAGELSVLARLCEQGDRAAEARAAIERDGAYINGRFGLREHPALATERQAAAIMARLTKQLRPATPTPRRLGGRSR